MKKIMTLGVAGAMALSALVGTMATAEAAPPFPPHPPHMGPPPGPGPGPGWYPGPGPGPGWNGGAFVAGTILGIAAAGAVGGYPYAGGNWNAHVQWCWNHYPNSFNPRTNTFVGYNGVTYYCQSPFN